MAEIISSDPFVPQRSSGFGADEPISDPFKPQPSSGFNPANAGFEDTGKLSGGAFSTGFKPTEAFSTGFEQHYSVSAADFNAVRTSLLEIQDKVSLALSTLESIAKVNTFSMVCYG